MEPIFEMQGHYAFGDSDTAARRLALLGEVFNPSSRSFVLQHAARSARVAVDLGCGPGSSTGMLAEATGATRTVGMDTSPAFLAAARRTAPAGVDFVEHDATQTPFPERAREADVIYARYLLTHLPDIDGTVHGWLSQLHPLGLLLLEDNDAIDTADPTCRHYLELTEQLLADRGATLYAGRVLAQLATSSRVRVITNEVRRLAVPTWRAAELFALNLSVWRTDPRVGQPLEVLDELAGRLDRVRETGGSEPVNWAIRQLALSPVESRSQGS